jgi:hypothetical protein
VQTFLPFPDFTRTARVLDDRRLGKQRVEALQVSKALTIPGYGWRHHPVVTMWRGHEAALARYSVEICAEWIRRGHADTCGRKVLAQLDLHAPPSQAELDQAGLLPSWLGDEALHRSHRSALLRKDPVRYSAFALEVPLDLPYVWPIPRLPGHPPTAG